MIGPSGNQKSSDFAMKRRKRLRPEVQSERPRVEVRDVAGREHVAAASGQMLASGRPDNGRRSARSARKPARSANREGRAAEDVPPAASIAEKSAALGWPAK